MTRRLSLLFLDCVLIVLAVLGALMCLCTAFQFALPKTAVLSVLLTAPLFCALLRLKKGWIAALVLLALLAGMAFLFFEELKNSVIRLIQLLMDHYINGYSWLADYYPQLEPDVTPDPAVALIAVTLLQTYLLSLSLSRWKRMLPGAVSLLLTAAPCFVLLDTPPAVLPLLLMSFALLVMALTQSVRRRAEGEAPAAMGIAALGAGLLLALLFWLFPYEGYEPPVRWDTVSAELERIGMELDNRGNAVAGLNGDARSVSLKQLTSLSNRPSAVMRVQADYSGQVYLRGLAFTAFDGSSWAVDSAADWGGECLFPELGLPAFSNIHVTTNRAESVIFTPAELTALPEGSTVVSDAFLENTDGRTEYTLSVGGIPVLSFDFWLTPEEKKQYAEWVGEACLSLPETTRSVLLDWWRENGIPGVLGTDYSVEDVAARLSLVAEYDRAPDRCPQERDFCDWFLNDAEAGYCVHYATCLTAMLRALGQPARYVTGYVCDAVAGEPVSVTALNAHAWTEYYAYGFWFRAEATPQSATEFTGVIPSERGEAVATERTEPLTPTGRPLPTEHTRPEPSGGPEETTEPTRPADNNSAQPAQPAQTGKGVPSWLLWVLGVLSVLALLIARRRILRTLRARRLAAADPNTETLLLWRRYRKLCRYLKSSPEEEWFRLANKAAFSQHRITEEELEPLRQEIRKQEHLLFWSGLAKRLYYCYIIAVI